MSGIKKALLNGPLVAILAQVKFTPIMQISEYVPRIQDRFRKNGFPLFNILQGESIQPKPSGDFERIPLKQWIFSSANYEQNLIIDNEQITYQTFDIQEYTYDGFIKKYLEVLKVFDEIVEVSAFTRFGLRYVNSIPEKKDVSWKTLIREGFQGVSFPSNHDWLDNALCSYMTQRGVNLEKLKMTSNFQLRIVQSPSGNKYPDDILKLSSETAEVFENVPKVTFLDIDHYIIFKSAPKEALFDKLTQIFNELHSVIEDVFFDTLITPEAIKKWS